MDSRGLYLNKWTLDFDLELDIPSAVPFWVHLPHLPLHCWGDESVRAIGNAVGKYIDRSEPKDNMQACTRICVEVDLGRGLPEEIKLKVDDWSHIQQLDYEQIPFKCKRTMSKMGTGNLLKRRNQPHPPKPSMDSDIPGPSNQRPPSSPPFPSGLSPDPPLPSSSNPFLILSTIDSAPENPSSEPLDSHLPQITTSQPPLEPLSSRITRSSSKEHGASSDTYKKPGPGRKSAKQHRDENG
eukprot:PITA_05656